MEDRLGVFFVMDGGGVDGLHGSELLLEPDNESFNIMVVVIRERLGVNCLGKLGELRDGAAVEVGQKQS